jgi:aquaporin Z
MRQYLMELIGTFLLTMAISFSGDPTVIGLMFMAIIYLGAHVSGGNYNPAVTIAAAIRRELKVRAAFIYMVMQLIGACIALWLYTMVTDNMFMPDGVPPIGVGMAFCMEALLTAVFAWVVVQTAMSKRFKGSMIYGLAAGFTLVALVGLGGMMNPAVALGAIVCSMFKGIAMKDTTTAFIYIVGPLVGGALAAYAFEYFNPDEK